MNIYIKLLIENINDFTNQSLENFNSLDIVKKKIRDGINAGWSYLGRLFIKKNSVYKYGRGGYVEMCVRPDCLPNSFNLKNELTAKLSESYKYYIDINGLRKLIPLYIYIKLKNNDKNIPLEYKNIDINDIKHYINPGYNEWWNSYETFAKKKISEKFKKLTDRVGFMWSPDYKYFYFIDLADDKYGVIDDYIESRITLNTYIDKVEKLKKKRIEQLEKEEEERKLQKLKRKEYEEKIKEIIDGDLIQAYNKGKELEELYKQDETIFEEKRNIDKEFNLDKLLELGFKKNTNDYIWYNQIKLDEISKIPEAFAEYTINNNWYEEERTIIYLIKDQGHYYKSQKYTKYYGSSTRGNWRGD